MDAIILAGGRGTRVMELAPEYYKPLLPYKGVPMVRLSVELALNAGVECPVVVVAPANAASICEVLEGLPSFVVVQRQPLGAGHALLLGLQVGSPSYFQVRNDRVLVLLSDNVSSDADVQAVMKYKTAVGVQQIDRRDAFRFARLSDDGRWVEKEKPPYEGAPVYSCWVGPFIGWRDDMMYVLSRAVENRPADSEVYIGPYLGEFMFDGDCHLVPVDSLDLGVADEYRRLT